MSKFFLLATLLLIYSSASQAEVNVMSFQAWKAARVDEARLNLEKLQANEKTGHKVTEKKSEAKSDGVSSRLQKSGRVDQKLQQAQLGLEVASELNVNDYFVLYLSQLKQREEFLDAAKKLAPEEMADLMLSYQKHLAGAQDSDIVIPPSASLTPPVSAKP